MAEDHESQFQRLLQLAARLMGSNGLSVRDLGGHSAAARRRIQRDLNKLRECGLPLQSTEHAERVPRYRIDNLRLAGGQLDLNETLAVTLSTLLVGNTDMGELARQGWDKLHYAVADGQERRVKADLPAHVSVQVGWALPKIQLRNLCTALLESRRLRIHYQGHKDPAPRWREIEPWQLFFQDRWYVHAYDPASQSAKNFRVERIHECHLTEVKFEIPAARPAANPHFHKWDLVESEPVTVVCQVDEKTARWLDENPVHPSQRLEGDLFILEIRDPDAFIQWSLGLDHCQVLRPLALRQRMRQRLIEMLARME